MDSIKEIQKHIRELKYASLSLTSASTATTKLIGHEMELSHELEKHMKDMQRAAEDTSDRARKIRKNIETESGSFEEVTDTLSQINTSIGSFMATTAEINSAAKQIQAASSDLDALE